MKLLTFNIRHGRGTDGLVNLHRIAQVIEESEADVVALTEVDQHFSRRSAYEDQLEWLANRLCMQGVFGAAIHRTPDSRCQGKTRKYGNAILSRFPIESHYNHPLIASPITLERRALLEARLKVGEQPISVYCTHLSLVPYLRQRQVKELLTYIQACSDPLVLMGDFNTRPRSRVWRLLTEHLEDASLATVPSVCHTFPAIKPTAQLDYIWLNRRWTVHSISPWRKCPEASDHLPLLAEATLESLALPQVAEHI